MHYMHCARSGFNLSSMFEWPLTKLHILAFYVQTKENIRALWCYTANILRVTGH